MKKINEVLKFHLVQKENQTLEAQREVLEQDNKELRYVPFHKLDWASSLHLLVVKRSKSKAWEILWHSH